MVVLRREESGTVVCLFVCIWGGGGGLICVCVFRGGGGIVRPGLPQVE